MSHKGSHVREAMILLNASGLDDPHDLMERLGKRTLGIRRFGIHDRHAESVRYLSSCRVEPYWIKATALRAIAPGRARAGHAAWRPVPPRRAGQAPVFCLVGQGALYV